MIQTPFPRQTTSHKIFFTNTRIFRIYIFIVFSTYFYFHYFHNPFLKSLHFNYFHHFSATLPLHPLTIQKKKKITNCFVHIIPLTWSWNYMRLIKQGATHTTPIFYENRVEKAPYRCTFFLLIPAGKPLKTGILSLGSESSEKIFFTTKIWNTTVSSRFFWLFF